MSGESFGRWLQRQMDRRQWTRAELARQTGVSATSISDWANGKKLPDAESADKLAEALRVDRDVVLDLVGIRPEEHDDPEQVRALIAMLRRVTLTGEREGLLRGILESMLAHDQATALAAAHPPTQREAG
jgi:transcriptional regulator with XRE-family HTH domain